MNTLYQRQRARRLNAWLDSAATADQIVVYGCAAIILAVILAWAAGVL